MTARQANREGKPWKRADGRWEVRVYVEGGPKSVYGKSRAEITRKRAELEAGTAVQAQANRHHAGDLGDRARPVRITVDLAPDLYAKLNRWVAEIGAEAGIPVSKADAMRALIRATADQLVSDVATDLLRK